MVRKLVCCSVVGLFILVPSIRPRLSSLIVNVKDHGILSDNTGCLLPTRKLLTELSQVAIVLNWAAVVRDVL